MKPRSRRYIAKKKITHPISWEEAFAMAVDIMVDRVHKAIEASQPNPKYQDGYFPGRSYSEPLQFHEGAAEIIKSSLDMVNQKSVFTPLPKSYSGIRKETIDRMCDNINSAIKKAKPND